MKCFITNAVEQRLDCHYYQPEFVELENRISKLTDKKLGDYIISIAGGATPDKNEVDKYYSDSENGVPFLRVQNVTPEGLKLENVVFINHETHNSMLKRSQVKGHYLITKITGVGRMAVSSVAPQDFTGNMNQHLVAIKTESSEVSRVLAAFLNSDTGERLASRRATGGTRPALDYEALKTIPIVFKPRIVDIMQSAYKLKKRKEREAQELLDSIDEYVLGELNIEIPVFEAQMRFSISAKSLEHRRIDVHYHQPIYEQVKKLIAKSKYPVVNLHEAFGSELVKGILPEGEEGDKKVLQIRNIGINGILDLNDIVKSDYHFEKELMIEKGDIIIVITGATIGKVGLWNVNDNFYLGGDMVKFKPSKTFDAYYIQAFLLSKVGQMQILRHITGATNKHLAPSDIKLFNIPKPPLEIQKRIGNELEQIITKAKELQQQASDGVEKAQIEVEHLILGT